VEFARPSTRSALIAFIDLQFRNGTETA